MIYNRIPTEEDCRESTKEALKLANKLAPYNRNYLQVHDLFDLAESNAFKSLKTYPTIAALVLRLVVYLNRWTCENDLKEDDLEVRLLRWWERENYADIRDEDGSVSMTSIEEFGSRHILTEKLKAYIFALLPLEAVLHCKYSKPFSKQGFVEMANHLNNRSRVHFTCRVWAFGLGAIFPLRSLKFNSLWSDSYEDYLRGFATPPSGMSGNGYAMIALAELLYTDGRVEEGEALYDSVLVLNSPEVIIHGAKERKLRNLSYSKWLEKVAQIIQPPNFDELIELCKESKNFITGLSITAPLVSSGEGKHLEAFYYFDSNLRDNKRHEYVKFESDGEIIKFIEALDEYEQRDLYSGSSFDVGLGYWSKQNCFRKIKKVYLTHAKFLTERGIDLWHRADTEEGKSSIDAINKLNCDLIDECDECGKVHPTCFSECAEFEGVSPYKLKANGLIDFGVSCIVNIALDDDDKALAEHASLLMGGYFEDFRNNKSTSDSSMMRHSVYHRCRVVPRDVYMVFDELNPEYIEGKKYDEISDDWFYRAAELGSSEGWYRYALYIIKHEEYNEGVEATLRAILGEAKDSRSKHSKAIRLLASLFAKGYGVEKSEDTAKYLLELDCENNEQHPLNLIEPIKFTIDEVYLAGAICSLRASIKGRKVRKIKCHLSKDSLKIDCGEWGCIIIPAKSEKVAKFKISKKSLIRAASCYRKYKGNCTEAKVELDKGSEYLALPEILIPIV